MALANEYLVFEADQVLTNDHLNQQFNYLDQQERWTRNKLIGIGIVCGLHLVQHPGVIEMTKGCGVTSQGYLILLETTPYTYYLPYAAVDEPKDLPFAYTGDLPFFKAFCQNKTIYRLLSDEEYNSLENEQKKTAQTLSSASPNMLADYVVVLFLETDEKDLKNCDAFDCNNRGEKIKLNVRPLLVRKNDLPGAKQSRDENAVVSALAPEPVLKRYNVPYTDLKSADDVINAFVKLVDDATLTSVSAAFNGCYQRYKNLLDVPANPFANLATELRARRDAILKEFPLFIQYFYDFVDDLIKAYREFILKLSNLLSECCPDENRFPLHLVLGEASANTNQFEAAGYRQYFIYSPLFDRRTNAFSETAFLFRRMQLLVENFIVRLPGANRLLTVKITPSVYEYALLSQRAIPYYYTPDEAGKELFRYWNYHKTLRGKADRNLSYNANLYSTQTAVVQPLLYETEPSNFFRIEGHIGRNYQTVLSNLLQQRQNFNLPFDVVAVSADQLPADDAALPECNIQDLETDYKLILSEFSCKAHTPFCYLTRFPYPPLQTPGTTVNNTTEIPSFPAFRATELKAANVAVLASVAYRKGDFMRRFCKPGERTVGTVYLRSLDSKGNFANPVQQVPDQNALLTLYFYFFEFIDAIEDLMQLLVPATVATLDADDAAAKFKRCTQNTTRLIYFLARYLESTGSNDQPWLKDLQLDLLVEEFILIVQSCLDERLQTLKDEYSRRLRLYLLQLNFLNYSKKHPGLEHKAGVPKGGTFVLVYHSAPRLTRPPLLAGETLRPLNRATLATVFETAATDTTPAISDSMLTLLRRFVDDCQDAPEERKKPVIDILTRLRRPAAQRYQIPANAVIADFYVPYLCCSDCSPVAYVLPGAEPQVVEFDIEPKEYLFDDADSYPFTTSPAVEELSQVTNPPPHSLNLLLKDEVLYLQPKMEIEETITATLTYKGQPVSLKIIRPDATFTATLTQDATGRPVLQVEAKQKDADSYEWTVNGVDGLFENSAEPPAVAVAVLREKLNNPREVKVTLTVAYTRNKHTAKDTKSTTVVLAQEVIFDIKPKEFLFDEGRSYAFTATPPVTDLAQVSNPDKLNLSVANNALFLRPAMALKVSLQATVSYQNKSVSLIIIRPDADFTALILRDDNGRSVVKVEAKDKGADEYAWTVNEAGGVIDDKPSPPAVLLDELRRKLNNPPQIVIQLTLSYTRNDHTAKDTKRRTLALQAIVDFERPLVLNTQYGGQFGQQPGATIFVSNNIAVKVFDFMLATGEKAFNFARIVAGGIAGGGQMMQVNNINLQFDFSKVGFEPTEVSFNFFRRGGIENLAVNGEQYVGDLTKAPAKLGGVAITVSEAAGASGRIGTLLLKGAVKNFAAGGQEFFLDNVVAKA